MRTAMPLLLIGLLGTVVLADEENPTSLDEQIAKYMTEKDPGKRDGVLKEIKGIEGITPQAVAEAIQRFNPWEKKKPGLQTLSVPIRENYTRQLLIELPAGYDPTVAYPVVFSFGGDEGDVCPLRKFIDLGSDEPKILVRLGAVTTSRLTVPVSVEFLTILHHLRKTFHMDNQRIILAGTDTAADTVMHLATFCPHSITGMICLGGQLQFPFLDQTGPMLKHNRKGMPAAVLSQTTTQPADMDGFHNQIRQVMKARLSDRQSSFEFWFRFPQEGKQNWLSVSEPGHKTWTAKEIGIMVPNAAHFDSFVRTTIQKKMFFLAGTLDAQTIDLKTEGIHEIELHLADGIVNLDKPLTIRLNGSVRFEGMFEKRIETMLELARKRWRFDQAVPIRVTIEEDRFARQRK